MIPLLVDLETEWRGGQNQALLLVRGLRERGHAAELLAARGSVLGQRARDAGVPVHFASREWLRLAAALKIRELLGDRRIELVHANEAHAVTAAWLARAHRRVPLLVSRRVGYPIGAGWIAQKRYRAAAKVVAISKWSAERAIGSGIRREQTTVVHEGVELPPPAGPDEQVAARARWKIPPGAPVFGCAGVLSRDKGQEWLVRALGAISGEWPECRLLLAGDGPDLARLGALAASLGVRERVIFAGFVEDVGAVYRALDVFVLPSLFEALSNALMSAMAAGVPSVAFDGGGPAEVIEDGKSGLLVPAGSDELLVAALCRLFRDPAFRARQGQGGRRRIEEQFSADAMVDGMLRVYREVLPGI